MQNSPRHIAFATAQLKNILSDIPTNPSFNSEQKTYFKNWLSENTFLKQKAPFAEIIACLEEALETNSLVEDEVKDLQWLLNSMNDPLPEPKDLKFLQDLISRINDEGILKPSEMSQLRDWVNARTFLQKVWPYDELLGTLTTFKYVERVPFQEIEVLKNQLNEFLLLQENPSSSPATNRTPTPVIGVCSLCPEVTLKGKNIFVTGSSLPAQRKDLRIEINKDLIDFVLREGARITTQINPQTDYLIVTADANPAWKYASYGRHVEAALKLKKSGHPLEILLETQLRKTFSSAA